MVKASSFLQSQHERMSSIPSEELFLPPLVIDHLQPVPVVDISFDIKKGSDLIMISLSFTHPFVTVHSRVKTKAMNSASFYSSIPMKEEKKHTTLPLSFRKIPPTRAFSGFLKDEPSVFHFNFPGFGGLHCTTLSDFLCLQDCL